MDRSNIQQKKKHAEIDTPILLAALSNKDVLKSTVYTVAATAVVKECVHNASFYIDLFNFNLGSRNIEEKNYECVCFHDLPPEVEKTINSAYRKLKDYNVAQIYKKLNLSCSRTNESSPIETKWVYHYCDTYNTREYSCKNKIDDAILLKPLTDIQNKEYQAMEF